MLHSVPLNLEGKCRKKKKMNKSMKPDHCVVSTFSYPLPPSSISEISKLLQKARESRAEKTSNCNFDLKKRKVIDGKLHLFTYIPRFRKQIRHHAIAPKKLA